MWQILECRGLWAPVMGCIGVMGPGVGLLRLVLTGSSHGSGEEVQGKDKKLQETIDTLVINCPAAW